MASQEDVAMITESAQQSITRSNNTPTQQRRITSRNPQWTYFHLQLIPHSRHPINNFTIDPLTARSYLTSALSQFLGLMGTSISIDILKIENPVDPAGQQSNTTSTSVRKTGWEYVPNVWIRVPRDDGAAVLAALSSWVGPLSSSSTTTTSAVPGMEDDSEGGAGVAWRVVAKGNFLNAVVHGSGQAVFNP